MGLIEGGQKGISDEKSGIPTIVTSIKNLLFINCILVECFEQHKPWEGDVGFRSSLNFIPERGVFSEL